MYAQTVETRPFLLFLFETSLIASLLVSTHWYVATVSGSQVLPYEGRGRGKGRMSQGWAGYTHKDGSMWKAHFVCVPSQTTYSGLGACPAGNVLL